MLHTPVTLHLSVPGIIFGSLNRDVWVQGLIRRQRSDVVTTQLALRCRRAGTPTLDIVIEPPISMLSCERCRRQPVIFTARLLNDAPPILRHGATPNR